MTAQVVPLGAGAPARAGGPADAGHLRTAFEAFATATERLEREYAALQARLASLTGELEEKNRLLAASLERERRLEAEALRQSRLAAMGEMAAMLAHEVRNPLGAMELFTGLLLQDLREQPEAQRLAQQVASGIVDLNHLVTNLLEFTRTQTPRRGVVDCCLLAEDALRYTADLRAANRVAVERRYAAPQVAAAGDPDLLRPVLLNLVRNALQAMPEGGALTIGAAPAADGVRITVADTGPGIPPAVREGIFRPFFTTRTRGTGLGLTVAGRLVTAMGGRLEVESEVGRGTTFTVVLPPVGGVADEPGEGGSDA
jgi:signal transduction histidine kinase